MFDDQGVPIREAGPATPVEVLGLDMLPEVGDPFQMVTDTAKAKQIVMFREAHSRDVQMAKNKRMTLEALHTHMKEGSVKDLNISIKADVGGSAEVRVNREKKVVFTGKISALKRFKDDASEVRTGFECGISINGFNDLEKGDIIEAFATEQMARDLS